MPTVFEIGIIKFKIHANDHNPPHVHVEAKGCEARFDLNTGALLSSDGFSRSQLKQIASLVENYKGVLLAAWSDLHDENL